MKTPEIVGTGEARFCGMTSPPIVYGDLFINDAVFPESRRLFAGCCVECD